MPKEEKKVIEEGKNYRIYNDGSIYLSRVRASYPHFGTPYEDEDDNGRKTSKFGVVAMLPKKTHKEAKEALKGVCEGLLKSNDVKIPNERWFLKDGDKSEKEVYEGHWTVATSESRRPVSRDRKRNVLEVEEADELFYGGCWINVLIRPWYFNGKSKNVKKELPKRLCCGIVSVQFVENDDPFGEGRISDDGVFDDVESDDVDSDDEDEL